MPQKKGLGHSEDMPDYLKTKHGLQAQSDIKVKRKAFDLDQLQTRIEKLKKSNDQ